MYKLYAHTRTYVQDFYLFICTTMYRLGVGGEALSGTSSNKPSFPIQSMAENSETEMVDKEETNERHDSSAATRGRFLSACEEVNELEDRFLPDPFVNNTLPRAPSPTTYTESPRSRKLLSARSSPNLVKTLSRSDMSEEEEDEDDIMELSFLPRTTNSHSRHSPFASPHLSSRNSPTHLTTYSSDEDIHLSSNMDGKCKITTKRRRSRFRNLHPLVRVDSGSSDDVTFDKGTRHSLPKFGKDNLRKMLHGYRSVPTTPADGSGSESISEIMLLSARRPRSNSARTDSSLSDVGDIGLQLCGRFEMSDGEELEHSGEELDNGGPNASPARTLNKKRDLTQSAICCLL